MMKVVSTWARDPANGEPCIIVTETDITGRKQLEKQMADAQAYNTQTPKSPPPTHTYRNPHTHTHIHTHTHTHTGRKAVRGTDTPAQQGSGAALAPGADAGRRFHPTGRETSQVGVARAGRNKP